MNSIGPNFRPPGQQNLTTGARPSETIQQSASAANEAVAGQGNRGPGSNLAPTVSLAALLAQQSPMAPDQMAQLLRNLLKMPREIVQFLAQLAEHDPETGQELLQQLMNEEVQIPLETLQGALEGKLGQAQQKLLKLIQGNPASMAGGGNNELGELMKGLSELAAQTGKSPAEALHSTITLYLPFYPLHPPQAFSLRFEPPDGEGEAGSEQDPQLVVYIETLSMGQFRASISTGTQSQWEAVIEHDAQASERLEAIQNSLNTIAPLEKATLFFLLRSTQPATASSQPAALPSDSPSSSKHSPAGQQSVGLHPTAGVSVLAVHAAYLLIRVILELDNQNALHQGRAAL